MHVPQNAMDLSHLSNHCVFRSSERVETHDQISSEFSDHGLAWKRGNVDTVLCKTKARQLQAFMLQYGAEVEIRPRPFKDFVLVHMSLVGTIEIDSDGQRTVLPPGSVAVLAPSHNLEMRWQQGAQQFILKMPTKLMADTAWAGTNRRPAPIQLLNSRQEAQWHTLMQSLVYASQVDDASPLHGQWVDHLERNAALYLGACAMTPQSHAVQSLAPASISGSDVRKLRSLDTYIRQRLCAPIALEDLARAAGTSTRGLNALCQRHYGQSPMVHLRNMRLDAIQDRLLEQASPSITELAFEYGFGHLGRFASYYKERFHELPSATAAEKARTRTATRVN